MTDDAAEHRREAISIPFSDIESKEREWIWSGYIAKGECTVAVGGTGHGKTGLLGLASGPLTNGGEMPDGSIVEPQRIMWTGVEDSPTTTLKPLLEQCGADVNRVDFLATAGSTAPDGTTTDEPIDLFAHRREIKRRLVARSTTIWFVDGVDSIISRHSLRNEHDTRSLYSWWQELAGDLHIAVVPVLQLKKTGADALSRIDAHPTIHRRARLVLGITPAPEHPYDPVQGRGKRFVFGCLKTNLSADPATLELVRRNDGTIAWVGPSRHNLKQVIERPKTFEVSPQRLQALELAHEYERPIKAFDLQARYGMSPDASRQLFLSMVRVGQMDLVARGEYAIPEFGMPDLHHVQPVRDVVSPTASGDHIDHVDHDRNDCDDLTAQPVPDGDDVIVGFESDGTQLHVEGPDDRQLTSATLDAFFDKSDDVSDAASESIASDAEWKRKLDSYFADDDESAP